MVNQKNYKSPRLNAPDILGLVIKAFRTQTGIRTIQFFRGEVDLFFTNLIRKVELNANTVKAELPITKSKNSFKGKRLSKI